jgi:putative ABC transport system permease protein
VFTGFVSGIYPALFISRFAPVQAMKETGKARGRSFINFRRVLVIAQVVCSVGLVIATAVFSLQLRYLRTKDLGYDRRNVLVTGFAGEWEQLGSFKEELLRFPGIKSVTYGISPTMGNQGHSFGSGDYDWEGKSGEARVNFDFVFVDEDYLKIYNSAMIQGRFFSKEFASDKDNYVLNESAIRAMGLKDPVGKSFRMGKGKGQIIGVVKDFHTSTLRAAIKPTLFRLSLFGQASIRFDPNQTPGVIRHLETVWKKFVPEQPLAYTFLEDKLDQLYEGDRSVSRIVSLFGLLSLIIAGLGLFGLVAFTAEQKTKEIGIRKVLGATVADIVRFMSKEFSILVGAAIVLAFPLGYYVGARWLGGFAYRIPLSWWIFAGSGAVVFTVTFLAMSWQAVKAATANPVQSLRSE